MISILLDTLFKMGVEYYVFSMPKWLIFGLRVYYLLEAYSGGVD